MTRTLEATPLCKTRFPLVHKSVQVAQVLATAAIADAISFICARLLASSIAPTLGCTRLSNQVDKTNGGVSCQYCHFSLLEILVFYHNFPVTPKHSHIVSFCLSITTGMFTIRFGNTCAYESRFGTNQQRTEQPVESTPCSCARRL